MRVYNVIVIGAGPAGIAASAYAHRLGLDTLLVYDVFGGQLNYTDKLHSIISASDIRCSELKRLHGNLVQAIDQKNCCITQVIRNDNGLFTIKSNNGASFYAHTVIVCTGRKPYIPSFENYLGKIYTFLDYPYSDVKMDDDVLIIGGGYTGLDICEQLSKKVNSIVIIEKNGCLGGNLERQKRVKSKPNVEIFYESNFQFSNDTKRMVTISSKGAAITTLPFTKLFACMGTCTNTGFLENTLLDDKNEIIINSTHDKKQDENMSPYLEGLFAAGDVIDRPITGYATIAESSGLKAAIAVYNYLLNKNLINK